MQETNATSDASPTVLPKRIGVLLGHQELDVPALKFLILQLNSLQHAFEFELLKCDSKDRFLEVLASDATLDRDQVKADALGFVERYVMHLEMRITEYELKEPPPSYFVLVSLAKFSEEFYTTRRGNLSVIALGNWKRKMAPPSILEFILTLLLREAVASI